MILTKPQILAEIRSGKLEITPFDKSALGPASIDLTLAPEIRVFDKIDHSVRVSHETEFQSITEKVDLTDKTYTMKPGELLLGITVETIKLPPDICAWLNSRSRFARLGLMVHITAPFIQPGEEGRQVLEIYNAGPNNLEIIPGEKLCQLIFQRCEGEAVYDGKFKHQEL